MLASYTNTDPNTDLTPGGPYQLTQGGYTVNWMVWDDTGAIAGAVTQFLNGIIPTANTKIIEVTVTGRGNRSSTVVFVRAQNV